MNTHKLLLPIAGFLLLFGIPISAQEILSLENAIMQSIENNFQVKLAENQTAISDNQRQIFNTGQLPSIALDGGLNYNLENTTATFQDGRVAEVRSASSYGTNISLGVNYTIFDGFFRKYNIELLQNQYKLSELQLRLTLENVLAQTLSQYYQLALLENNVEILEETLSLTRERLRRAESQFEFAQVSRLAILNAQVDLNNDSLNLINARFELDNGKRLLNNILVREADDIAYDVEKDFEFVEGFIYSKLKAETMASNTNLTINDKTIELGNLQIKLAEARQLPQFDLNSSYGFSYNRNNPAAFLSSASNNGLTAGITARWNIFDGGARKTAIENAKLEYQAFDLQKAQQLNNIELQFENAWNAYENALKIYETESSNLEISQENFRRSDEQFKSGLINSVEYRTAQLNLINSKLRQNTAKFRVKISEVELLLLSGQLIDLY